jgi:microsomal dipeptidase-like Zn-dependent dipeptidase
MKRILTDEDIKRIWENMAIITLNNVADFIEGGGVKPIIMSNGYNTAMTIDVLSDRISIYHLSINNPKGKTGIVTAQKMAQEIFGEGYTQLDIETISGCIQFIKKK